MLFFPDAVFLTAHRFYFMTGSNVLNCFLPAHYFQPTVISSTKFISPDIQMIQIRKNITLVYVPTIIKNLFVLGYYIGFQVVVAAGAFSIIEQKKQHQNEH